jgi:Asparagine synthase (glutamine-hydrolyzing)
MTLAGASPATVRTAIEESDPLPGTAGFAGETAGLLVRDVLGRYPLFFESTDPTTWSHDPATLAEPQRLPAGHVCPTGDNPTRHGQVGHPRRHWTLPGGDPFVDDETAVAAVRAALEESLSAVAATVGDDLAVAFSGGIDSGLLAARFDAPLYVVGFPDSHDVEAARSGAAMLGQAVRVVELDHATLEAAIPQVAAAINRTNPMDVQIALPLFVLAEQVSADGFDRLALGQAADELFGGYAKVENAPDDHRVAADTVRGARDELLDTVPDQFERDRLALRAAGVDPVTPFAHDRVVRAALSLDGDQLVRNGARKWALRRAADPWLPDDIANRDKKALQYGTLVSRELDRLARQAGYKRRIDDHVRKYIRSL